MSRSLKKGPYVYDRLLKKMEKTKPGGAPIKTWARDSMIAPEMVGFIFSVHNGKDFIDVSVKEEMVGHRFGEFAPTKKFLRHGGKMQKQLEASAAQKQAPAKSGK